MRTSTESTMRFESSKRRGTSREAVEDPKVVGLQSPNRRSKNTLWWSISPIFKRLDRWLLVRLLKIVIVSSCCDCSVDFVRRLATNCAQHDCWMFWRPTILKRLSAAAVVLQDNQWDLLWQPVSWSHTQNSSMSVHRVFALKTLAILQVNRNIGAFGHTAAIQYCKLR